MKTGTITRETVHDQIEWMTEHAYRVEEGARIWRGQVETDAERSALYDIELAAQNLSVLVQAMERD